MGVNPEKIQTSLIRELDAFYNAHMFTNRPLHHPAPTSCTATRKAFRHWEKALILNFGSPKQLRARHGNVAQAGVAHGSQPGWAPAYQDQLFQWTQNVGRGRLGMAEGLLFPVFQPGALLVQFNGALPPASCFWELADGLLAHRKPNANGGYSLHKPHQFPQDEE